VLKQPKVKRSARCYSISIAFVSIDGIKCDILMFGRKNSLSCDIFPMPLEGHLRVFICGCTFYHEPWRFYQIVLWRDLAVKD
jgi:hypothetical protein